MVAILVSSITPQQIFSVGQDIVDVILTEWGTDERDCYPTVFNALGGAADNPNFPFTPQAITIGPRSTIDRCWVTWNPQSRGLSARLISRPLTPESPILFSNAAGVGGISTATANPICVTAQSQGLLYVFPHVNPVTVAGNADPGFGLEDGYQSTLLPGSFLQADGTVNNQFFNPAGITNVIRPRLHLQFHLKAGTALPLKRAPWHNGFQISTIMDPDNEGMVFGWPVYGRKTISLQVRSDVAGGSFRVGALRNVQRSYQIQETTEGDLPTTAINESIRFRFCDLVADYLILYHTRPAAGGQPTISGTITAYD